ncbi:MAG TPA: universal stress protein [Blastocatellia bacterium]|nr:universal stress protein [Blastocatellia bacterium]
MKILLAVDGSAYSDAAVQSVANRPWPAGTVIKVFSAIELPFVPTTETWALPDSYYVELEKSGEEKARAALQKAVNTLRERQGMVLEITTEMHIGQAQSLILDEAEKWGADLIVLGSHGYRGFKRFLLGSVSQSVAAHAKCSVEIVRSKELTE